MVSLGQTQLSWSAAKLNSGQSREAGDVANQALATWSKLAGRSADLGYIQGLAAARACLARAELQNGNAERALSILDEALRENQRVVDRDSRNLYAVGDKYRMHTSRASALRVLKRFEMAAEDMRAAIKAAEFINQRFAEHLVLLAGDLAMSGQPAEVLELARSTAEEMNDMSRKKYLMQLARSACIASKAAEEVAKKELEEFAADALVQLAQLGTSLDREAFAASDFDPIRTNPKIKEFLD